MNSIIDIFDKYYDYIINKLDKNNKYYEMKKDNYNLAKKSYNRNSYLNSKPIRATIQTTEYCNLSCIMCQIHGKKLSRDLKQMNKDIFNIIVKELFPYLIVVHPTNIGEPLISPWFDYFIEKAIEYGVMIDLTTNGMLLTNEIIKKILPNLLDIKISFDAYNKNTFEVIRKGAKQDIIIKNIRKLIWYRNKIKNNFTITLQMTLLTLNYKELLDIIRFAADEGINSVKAYHVFAYNKEIKKLSLIENLDEFEEIRVKAINLANKLNIRLEISEPNINIEKFNLSSLIKQPCRLLWTECWFDTNGSFYPCHSHGQLNYGNIRNMNFINIWNSEELQYLRKYQIKGYPQGICKNCGMNYMKKDENQEVPYDIEGFINENNLNSKIKWSNRSKQFMLNR